ncbi:hypothetical protein RHGRI_037166 [Rhododendron griersonianum]|uniref:Gustatory receptor n=1 Tax=Rhododendron griersonianum TaxID=479676 RepID=A0AAV6HW58_9ERIC|nr:hypothetical protein RHGRI_037166 [Rhododendron griersonianum]
MEDQRHDYSRNNNNNNRNKEALYPTPEGLELKSFKSFLTWVCLDQSNKWRAGLSASIFFVLAIGVPIVSHFVFSCSSCDAKHRRPYDGIVQLSLSFIAALSFYSLSSFAHTYGLRRFLFLDKLGDASEKVRQGYTQQLRLSLKLLSAFVLPCFLADSVYKIWWFVSGETDTPYFVNLYASDVVSCTLQLFSWLYRTSIFILVCILFRLICYLQILRLEDFSQVFEKESDVGSILIEHLTIRRNLRIISHRFRVFVLLALVLVTISQLASLVVTTKSGNVVNIYTAGELALCSITLVTGLFICLRSATKITHKAQAVTCLATKWHVCATIDSFNESDGDSPRAHGVSSPRMYPVNGNSASDNEEADGDDVLDNTKMVPIFAHTISYQKRQALVTYFANNRAGITVFGFMLDRTWLHTIFAIQLSLTLWLLNKTVGM